MKREQRLPVLDLLRVISILGVVLVHTSSRTLEQSGYDILRIPLTLVLNEITRFAVPLFFIISGFILEHKYKVVPVQDFYRKRISRIVIPYIIWNCIYYLIYYQNNLRSLFTINFLQGLLVGNISIQMYFIPALILLYICFPFLHSYLSVFKKYLWELFVVFIVGTFIDYYFKLPIPDPLRLLPLNIFVFALGMIAAQYQKEIVAYTRSRKWIVLCVMFLSAVGSVYESKYMFLWYRNNYTVGSNWRICLYMYTFAIGAILYTYCQSFAWRYQKIIEKLSSLSFFIFFVHLFFLKMFWRFVGSYLLSHSMGHVLEFYWFDPLVFLVTSSCSFGCAYVVSYIPYLRSLLGITQNATPYVDFSTHGMASKTHFSDN